MAVSIAVAIFVPIAMAVPVAFSVAIPVSASVTSLERFEFLRILPESSAASLFLLFVLPNFNPLSQIFNP